jgi:hypothetical protein
MAATVTDTARYRVHCAEHDTIVPNAQVARIKATDADMSGLCMYFHTAEEKVDGEWVPVHVAEARRILAAPVGPDSVFDGLIKGRGGWTRETAAQADATADAGTPQWRAALGPHQYAILTSDGSEADTGRWHIDDRCGGPAEDGDWVRYERWTAEGRVGHGFVCRSCRGLLQTG